MIADQPTNSQDQLGPLLDFSTSAFATTDASTTKMININEPLIDIEFPVSKQTGAFDEGDEDIPPLSEITERVNRILNDGHHSDTAETLVTKSMQANIANGTPEGQQIMMMSQGVQNHHHLMQRQVQAAAAVHHHQHTKSSSATANNNGAPGQSTTTITTLFKHESSPFYPQGRQNIPQLGQISMNEPLYQDPFVSQELQTKLEKAINVNKMQHHYIQNLQKANLFLKQKLKDFEEIDKLIKTAGINAVTSSIPGLIDKGNTSTNLVGMIQQKSNDYKLVSIGQVKHVSSHDAEPDQEEYNIQKFTRSSAQSTTSSREMPMQNYSHSQKRVYDRPSRFENNFNPEKENFAHYDRSGYGQPAPQMSRGMSSSNHNSGFQNGFQPSQLQGFNGNNYQQSYSEKPGYSSNQGYEPMQFPPQPKPSGGFRPPQPESQYPAEFQQQPSYHHQPQVFGYHPPQQQQTPYYSQYPQAAHDNFNEPRVHHYEQPHSNGYHNHHEQLPHHHEPVHHHFEEQPVQPAFSNPYSHSSKRFGSRPRNFERSPPAHSHNNEDHHVGTFRGGRGRGTNGFQPADRERSSQRGSDLRPFRGRGGETPFVSSRGGRGGAPSDRFGFRHEGTERGGRGGAPSDRFSSRHEGTERGGRGGAPSDRFGSRPDGGEREDRRGMGRGGRGGFGASNRSTSRDFNPRNNFASSRGMRGGMRGGRGGFTSKRDESDGRVRSKSVNRRKQSSSSSRKNSPKQNSMGRRFDNMRVDSKSRVKREASSEIRIDHASLKENQSPLPRDAEKSPKFDRSPRNQFDNRRDFERKISKSSSIERINEIRSDEQANAFESQNHSQDQTHEAKNQNQGMFESRQFEIDEKVQTAHEIQASLNIPDFLAVSNPDPQPSTIEPTVIKPTTKYTSSTQKMQKPSLTPDDLQRVEILREQLQRAVDAQDKQDIAEILFDIKADGFHKNGIIDISQAEEILFD
eukprot:403332012